MDAIFKLPKQAWIIIGVFVLLVIIASYAQGKVAGINKCTAK